jgi:hypothetical protein
LTRVVLALHFLEFDLRRHFRFFIHLEPNFIISHQNQFHVNIDNNIVKRVLQMAGALGSLVFSHASKPFVWYMKNKAAKSPFFRERICVPMGLFYNRISQKTLKATGLQQLPTITRAEAVEIGVDVYGELVVFAIGAFLILASVLRSKKQRESVDHARDEAVSSCSHEVASMTVTLDAHEKSQERRISALTEKMKELEKVVTDFHGQKPQIK